MSSYRPNADSSKSQGNTNLRRNWCPSKNRRKALVEGAEPRHEGERLWIDSRRRRELASSYRAPSATRRPDDHQSSTHRGRSRSYSRRRPERRDYSSGRPQEREDSRRYRDSRSRSPHYGERKRQSSRSARSREREDSRRHRSHRSRSPRHDYDRSGSYRIQSRSRPRRERKSRSPRDRSSRGRYSLRDRSTSRRRSARTPPARAEFEKLQREVKRLTEQLSAKTLPPKDSIQLETVVQDTSQTTQGHAAAGLQSMEPALVGFQPGYCSTQGTVGGANLSFGPTLTEANLGFQDQNVYGQQDHWFADVFGPFQGQQVLAPAIPMDFNSGAILVGASTAEAANASYSQWLTAEGGMQFQPAAIQGSLQGEFGEPLYPVLPIKCEIEEGFGQSGSLGSVELSSLFPHDSRQDGYFKIDTPGPLLEHIPLKHLSGHGNVNEANGVQQTITDAEQKAVCEANSAKAAEEAKALKAYEEVVRSASSDNGLARCSIELLDHENVSAVFHLHPADVLSLPHIERIEGEGTQRNYAWATDRLMQTLLEQEPSRPGACLAPAAMLEVYLHAIREAIDSEYLELGLALPFSDLPGPIKTVIFPYNPSGSHWVTVEAILYRQRSRVMMSGIGWACRSGSCARSVLGLLSASPDNMPLSDAFLSLHAPRGEETPQRNTQSAQPPSDAIHTPRSGEVVNTQSAEAQSGVSSGRIHARWSDDDVAKLKEAFERGMTDKEIQEKILPKRSLRAIQLITRTMRLLKMPR
ncbi:uncharacterized protein EI97DRAFT_442512 [Westerdykella ornata]|uniref:Uncharacterized protein n=1 Tax=Westerdykella ornata TaxID=318751 RepID=A0A6A6JNT9_WESOR|nr:uncharacterized protein EI97DRAFT_442512 [Westerdykella ornata]KAF2276599.1 hypothetical protein EI97DRAFT_442512 [Westerdykella ornata]